MGATTVALIFAMGFYLVTALAVTRTRRLTGHNPVTVFHSGNLEEIGAVLALWIFPLVLILSTLQPQIGQSRPLVDVPVLRGAGVVLLLGGLVLQYVSIVTLGRAFRIGLDPEQREHLVRYGPYRYVRHPIYTAFLGFFVGAWLLQPTVLFTIVVPLAIARITLQAAREERMLLATFGDEYRDYVKSTKRFIPGVV